MDSKRSPDVYIAGSVAKDIRVQGLEDGAEEQLSLTSEHGTVAGMASDSEDDLFLGADAQIFSKANTPQTSPRSSSKSAGRYFESSSDSTEPTRRNKEARKLCNIGRANSSDSILSNFSDFSWASHGVNSLLNAMTVDPEEFLTDLGFAETDLRVRIPERFFQSASNAHGIDVDSFRRSLETDDVFGSSPQESSVWSEPGSCRIPSRFITCPTEPTNTLYVGPYSSVPLISEPEEAPEESFDLMRHLRLNKPQHVTKGVYLEPVTEELEVSSVGSGTIRTRISRKLSNEEGTIIVREESSEQPNLDSELVLNVPSLIVSEKTSFDSNELADTNFTENNREETAITANLNVKESESILVRGGTLLDYGVSSSGITETGNSSQYRTDSDQFALITSDHSDMEDVEGNPVVDFDSRVADISPLAAVPVHLKVGNIAVQDSFELEEIGNEYFNEKECSSFVDEESGYNSKASDNRMTRENSGESSGFEEMFPDKDAASSNSCSPVLNVKGSSTVECTFVSDVRPLKALLDPELICRALEEKSPRGTFAQRRTKSLTKQRPVDEDGFGLWVSGSSSPLSKYVAGSIGNSVGQNYESTSLDFAQKGSSFLSRKTEEPVDLARKSDVDGYDGEIDENFNRKSKSDLEQLPLAVVSSTLEKYGGGLDKDTVSSETKGNEKINDGKSASSIEIDPHIVERQSKFGPFVSGTSEQGSGSFVKDNQVSAERLRNEKPFHGEFCVIVENDPNTAMRQTTISPVVSGTSEIDDTSEEKDNKALANSVCVGDQGNGECFSDVAIEANTAMNKSRFSPIILNNVTSENHDNISDSSLTTEEFVSPQSLVELSDDGYFHAKLLQTNSDIGDNTENCVGVAASGNLSVSSLGENEDVSACVEQQKRKESRKALQKVDSECLKQYLHEINILEQSVKKYESNLSPEGQLDRAKTLDDTESVLVRINEEVSAIQELRVMIGSELERMKFLLSERRRLLLAGVAKNPVCFGVSQSVRWQTFFGNSRR
ncbi:uncharacterized protein LOC111336911 isoform X3 [Stylophora pistillata]|uniref:uncharacterized protein LOC111336911 isoform X3 n=1 Tax=Stylophora pistillata TaxID=50429 RepID=UPI000C056865|nr:uncharacterized protein LOC111336911 isoform X3 [Stylophora pistillata]